MGEGLGSSLAPSFSHSKEKEMSSQTLRTGTWMYLLWQGSTLQALYSFDGEFHVVAFEDSQKNHIVTSSLVDGVAVYEMCSLQESIYFPNGDASESEKIFSNDSFRTIALMRETFGDDPEHMHLLENDISRVIEIPYMIDMEMLLLRAQRYLNRAKEIGDYEEEYAVIQQGINEKNKEIRSRYV